MYLQELELSLPIGWNNPWWSVLLSIEHERLHIETSAMLLRQLSIDKFENKTNRVSIWDNDCQSRLIWHENNYRDHILTTFHDHDNDAPENGLLPVPAINDLEYGRDRIRSGIDGDSENISHYGWDNEFGNAIIRNVPSFNASKYLVSNQEFYQFVLDDGYNNKQYWTQEGWKWVTTTNTTHPKFWIKTTININITNTTKTRKTRTYTIWKYRTLLNEIELPWNWPVTVNQLEAHAFTQWKSSKTGQSIRLPTEDELVALLVVAKSEKSVDSDIWKDSMFYGNTDMEYFSSEAPVDMFQFGTSGFYDVVGNVWQHTLTPMHPFKGFNVHPYFDDYSIIGFGDKHNIMRGGSWISSGTFSSKYSMYTRNWFRRHFFQFAGFRYVESSRDLSFLDDLANIYKNEYESNDEMINLQIHLHYCDEITFGVSNYPKTVADIAIKHMNISKNISMYSRALDIGCGAGRTTFELAKKFDHVTGIDFTTRLISVGYKLKEQGYLEWDVPYQGDIKEHYRVTLDELGLNDEITNKVYFAQNDAQNLDPQYDNYDLVVASNLIEELSNPLLFLINIHERVNIGGKLILLSKYSWDEEKTNKDMWIGGKYLDQLFNNTSEQSGWSDQLELQSNDILTKLNDTLSDWFVFENDEEVEMIQRENKRTYQHSMVHCTIWRRL